MVRSATDWLRPEGALKPWLLQIEQSDMIINLAEIRHKVVCSTMKIEVPFNGKEESKLVMNAGKLKTTEIGRLL